jgi:hypothetical protein
MDVANRAPMKSQQPIQTDEEHRVLKFQPRTAAARAPHQRSEVSVPPLQDSLSRESSDLSAKDLSAYERPPEEPDDFRHRMLANTAALAFTVALTAIGIWLAMSIADMRKTQDCVMMGRRDCGHISSPQS